MMQPSAQLYGGTTRARDAKGLVLFRACFFGPEKTEAERSPEQPARAPKTHMWWLCGSMNPATGCTPA